MNLPTALIVSEETTKPVMLKKILKSSFHLIERADVKEALELLKQTPVDLIILDAKMKHGHNIELAEKLRAAVFKETPILLITSNLKKSFAQVALNSGITDFINEPLDKDEIEQRIAVSFKNQDRPKKISPIAERSTPKMRSSLPLTKRELLSDQAINEITKARIPLSVSIGLISLDKSVPGSSDEVFDKLLEGVKRATVEEKKTGNKIVLS